MMNYETLTHAECSDYLAYNSATHEQLWMLMEHAVADIGNAAIVGPDAEAELLAAAAKLIDHEPLLRDLFAMEYPAILGKIDGAAPSSSPSLH